LPFNSPDGEKIGWVKNKILTVGAVVDGSFLGQYDAPRTWLDWISGIDDDGKPILDKFPESYQISWNSAHIGYLDQETLITEMGGRDSTQKIYSKYCMYTFNGTNTCHVSQNMILFDSKENRYELSETEEKGDYAIFSVQSGESQQIGSYHGEATPYPVTLTEDRNYFFLGSSLGPWAGGKVEIWDIRENKVIKTWPCYLGANVITSDQKTIAFSKYCSPRDKSTTLYLYNLETKRQTTLPVPGGVSFISLIPIGDLAYGGTSCVSRSCTAFITIRETSSNRVIQELKIPVTVFITNAGFSPYGTMLAIGGLDGIVSLFDYETVEELFTFSAHPDQIMDMAFSQDGKLLVTSATDGLVKIWGVWP
jgi:WD40 repeat protein